MHKATTCNNILVPIFCLWSPTL